MKRLPHVAILLLAACLVAADKGEKKKSDAEKIQGTWIVVEAHHKGKNDGRPAGNVLTFLGKKMTMVRKGTGQKIDGAFELRTDKKPRELDMVFKAGDAEYTVKAIYELSVDTLKICAFDSGEGRPDAVGSAADDKRSVLVLKRVKDKGDDKK